MLSNVDLAIYNTVHNFRRGDLKGASGLAEILGKVPGTFANKANPTMPGHYFRPDELIAIMNVTEDYQILHAINHACHHSAVPLEDFSNVSDMALLDAYAHLHEELGKTSAVIRQAFADGQITRREFDHIDREMTQDIRAMLELRARMQHLVVDE